MCEQLFAGSGRRIPLPVREMDVTAESERARTQLSASATLVSSV
jgi:hypothetical protein